MPEPKEKPCISFYEESVKKWEDGLESLKSTPLNSKALKSWFDDLICEKCGFCKYYIKCEKCPLLFALACSRLSDSRVIIWQIWVAAYKGDKGEAILKTEELLTKIRSLKEFFA